MNYSNLKTAVIGITKNNANCISRGIKNMMRISELFNDSIVYIYENDSTDNTVNILADWKSNYEKKFYYSSEKRVKRYSYHTQNIAQARQKALNWVRTYYKDFDLLIILDPDLFYDINLTGIVDSLNNMDKWDACFANGIYNMKGMTWDAFAMRTEDQNIPWHGNKNYFSNFHKKANWGTGRIIKEWTEVFSAFGGLGIYKANILKDINYDLNSIDCEHVPFHNNIRKRIQLHEVTDDISEGQNVIYKKFNSFQIATIKEIHRDDYPNMYYTISINSAGKIYEKQTTKEYIFTYTRPKLMINPKMIRIYSMREGVKGGYEKSSFR